MKLLVLCILLPALAFAQDADFDLVLKNGKIIDGSGNSWFYSDVAVKNG